MLTFNYLGRVVVYDGTDLPASRRQLKRVQAVWGCLFKVVTKDRESVLAPAVGMFCQAVVAAVLLYGCGN